MPDGADDYRRLAELAAEIERAELRHAFNNSMAGRETGRMEVGFVGEAAPLSETQKRRERNEKLLLETALALMLRDPIYRKRYEAFGVFLEDRVDATKTALEQALASSQAAQTALTDLVDGANRLPDGRKVFVTVDGRIVGTDGQEVSADEAAQVIWSQDAPSYEAYLAAKKKAEEAEQTVSALQDYQLQLDQAQDRWENDEAPITSDEMDALQDALEQSAPEIIQDHLQPNSAEIDAKNNLGKVGSLNLKG